MGLAYLIILHVKAKLEVSLSAFEFHNPVSLARVKDFIHNGFCFERKSLICGLPLTPRRHSNCSGSRQKTDDDLFSLIKISTG